MREQRAQRPVSALRALSPCFIVLVLLGLGPGPVCTASSTVLAVLLYWLSGVPGCQYFDCLRTSCYSNASLNSENPSLFTA